MRALVISVGALALGFGAAVSIASGAGDASGTATFTYAGSSAQTFTVPATVSSVHIRAVGARGGDLGRYVGGAGALVNADLAVTPGDVLQLRVGGVGSSSGSYLGGYNGGGNGAEAPCAPMATTNDVGAGGGGATSVSTGTGTLLLAAGGGGGGADLVANPLACSGTTGGNGGATETSGEGGTAGGGASADAAGTGGGGQVAQSGGLGTGGNASGVCAGGGGGGGWYGGGAGACSSGATAGGGGGSSNFTPNLGVTGFTKGVAGTGDAATVTISWGSPQTTTQTTTSTTSTTQTTSTTPTTTPPPPAASGLTLASSQRGSAVTAAIQLRHGRSTVKSQLQYRKTKTSKAKVLGSSLRALAGPGRLSIRVKLNSTGRKLLKAKHKLRLTLVVTVTPPTGAAVTLRHTVTLRR